MVRRSLLPAWTAATLAGLVAATTPAPSVVAWTDPTTAAPSVVASTAPTWAAPPAAKDGGVFAKEVVQFVNAKLLEKMTHDGVVHTRKINAFVKKFDGDYNKIFQYFLKEDGHGEATTPPPTKRPTRQLDDESPADFDL